MDPLLFAQELDPVLDTFAIDQPLRRGTVRSVAYHQQPCGHLLRDPGEDLDHIEDALDRPEVRKVEQDLFLRIGVTRPGVGAPLAQGFVFVAVDEVGNDFDGPQNAEVVHRFLPQVIGYRGDTIALFDGEAGNGQIRPVEPHQGDIGTVQGGDKGQIPAFGQHLAGQQCAHRVGNGVVDVKQVELVIFGHFRHACGQGQIVGRVFEEGVIGDRHLVIENTFFAPGEPERLRIGDEVHLVAARRELNAEFRRDHATAAVGRITRDADFHSMPP